MRDPQMEQHRADFPAHDIIAVKRTFPEKWYKEKRTPEEARRIYRRARRAGVNWAQAMRIRYWSMPHIQQFISNIKKIRREEREERRKERALKRMNKVKLYTLALCANGKVEAKKLPYMLYLTLRAIGRKARKSSAVRRFMDVEFPKIMCKDLKEAAHV